MFDGPAAPKASPHHHRPSEVSKAPSPGRIETDIDLCPACVLNAGLGHQPTSPTHHAPPTTSSRGIEPHIRSIHHIVRGFPPPAPVPRVMAEKWLRMLPSYHHHHPSQSSLHHNESHLSGLPIAPMAYHSNIACENDGVRCLEARWRGVGDGGWGVGGCAYPTSVGCVDHTVYSTQYTHPTSPICFPRQT